MDRFRWQAAVVGILALTVAVSSGCGTLNTQKNTYISVQFSGRDMLHLAVIPRVLPNGQPAARQRDALLKDVADVAGGYTLIPRVMRAWKSKGMAEPAEESADDLLMVEGPPELGLGLKQRLHDDFGQPTPFVWSIPLQNIRIAAPTPLPLEKPVAPPGPQKPTEQKPAK